MTAILGISAYYHDSAAALIVDGELVAAAQEERFTRRKHDGSFPVHAIEYCLESVGLSPSDLAHVAFYEKPLLRFERLLETYLAIAPRGFASFRRALPIWLRTKVHLGREMRAHLPGFERRFVFMHHHRSHAASAFFPSPFERAAILTLDGVGEWATGSIGLGEGNRISLLQEQRFPHSIGLFYSAMTSFAGFRVNSGEYKLMGLAPYGEPRFVDKLRSEVIQVREDGSVWLDMSYFNYLGGLTMSSRKLEGVLEGAAHPLGVEPTQREMDIAASAQAIVEDAVLKSARHAHRETGATALCMAGGVALNSVANGRLLREGPFEQVWVQPAAGDAGGALGAALFAWHQLMDRARTPRSDSLGVRSLALRLAMRASLKRLKARAFVPSRTLRSMRSFNRSRGASPSKRWWAGFRDGWSSDPGRSARAASWRIHGERRCAPF